MNKDTASKNRASKEKVEMFEALHPDPAKQGTRVTKSTYDAYKAALLAVIPATEDGIEYGALSKAVVPHLSPELVEKTSQGWWVTSVKLDLEARGMIERVPTKGKQRVRRLS